MALRREAVLDAAVALADTKGLSAVTMRRVGDALGVEAMSLYRYVAGKDDLLDGMVDAVFAAVPLPEGPRWRPALRRRAHDVRAALRRHPWSLGLLDSRRTPGPATLRHHEAVLGVLRGDGFDVPAAAHAYSVLDSYVYGFALQQASMPFDTAEESVALAREIVGRFADGEYPHLAEFAAEHVMVPGYDYGDEFAWGLDLVLDGLERLVEG